MGLLGANPGSFAQCVLYSGNVLLSPSPQLTCSKNGWSNFNYLTRCRNFCGFKKNVIPDYFSSDYI